MKTVILNKNEVYIASIVGIRRNITSRDSKDCNKVQNKDFGWHIDIEAAGAELAFAKYMGLYWDFSVNTFKKQDVGGYQVRHTQVKDGKLIIRPKDNPEEKYVLIVGTGPEYLIAGWIWGYEAKQDQHIFKGFNGMPDCWMVHQESLDQFDDQNTILEEEIMAFEQDKVIWITDKAGVVPEEYNGKWSLKAVQKYTSQGAEKVSYDWVHKEKWNPETRQREMPAKANAAMGVYLGSKDQAIKALESMLLSLGKAAPALEGDDVPF
jgi:hypothetical protein